VPIHYLNTDLDLIADHDLTPLVDALQAGGMTEIYRIEENGRRAGLELASGPGSARVTGDDVNDGRVDFDGVSDRDRDAYRPATTIAGLLDVLEAMDADTRAAWDACRVREFNIGYGCGDRPWGLHQSLDASLLARVAALGAGLRITIYPATTDTSEVSVIAGTGDSSDQHPAVP
jgi:hypothetical protein